MASSTNTAATTPVPYGYQAGGYQTRPWTEPVPSTWNSTASAVCNLNANTVGWFLVIANGFGFAIPAGATIDGIVIDVECSGGSGKTYDSEVVAVKGGVVGSTSRASATVWSGGSHTWLGHGTGQNDLWGTTWTPAQINAADFGVAVSPKSVGGTDIAEIHNVRITVYYTPTSIKTINGLTKSSVKTWNGLAMSSVKSINGLT